jgi:hypothetical protein
VWFFLSENLNICYRAFMSFNDADGFGGARQPLGAGETTKNLESDSCGFLSL